MKKIVFYLISLFNCKTLSNSERIKEENSIKEQTHFLYLSEDFNNNKYVDTTELKSEIMNQEKPDYCNLIELYEYSSKLLNLMNQKLPYNCFFRKNIDNYHLLMEEAFNFSSTKNYQAYFRKFFGHKGYSIGLLRMFNKILKKLKNKELPCELKKYNNKIIEILTVFYEYKNFVINKLFSERINKIEYFLHQNYYELILKNDYLNSFVRIFFDYYESQLNMFISKIDAHDNSETELNDEVLLINHLYEFLKYHQAYFTRGKKSNIVYKLLIINDDNYIKNIKQFYNFIEDTKNESKFEQIHKSIIFSSNFNKFLSIFKTLENNFEESIIKYKTLLVTSLNEIYAKVLKEGSLDKETKLIYHNLLFKERVKIFFYNFLYAKNFQILLESNLIIKFGSVINSMHNALNNIIKCMTHLGIIQSVNYYSFSFISGFDLLLDEIYSEKSFVKIISEVKKYYSYEYKINKKEYLKK